jgi:hypothetical protein
MTTTKEDGLDNYKLGLYDDRKLTKVVTLSKRSNEQDVPPIIYSVLMICMDHFKCDAERKIIVHSEDGDLAMSFKFDYIKYMESFHEDLKEANFTGGTIHVKVKLISNFE